MPDTKNLQSINDKDIEEKTRQLEDLKKQLVDLQQKAADDVQAKLREIEAAEKVLKYSTSCQRIRQAAAVDFPVLDYLHPESTDCNGTFTAELKEKVLEEEICGDLQRS